MAAAQRGTEERMGVGGGGGVFAPRSTSRQEVLSLTRLVGGAAEEAPRGPVADMHRRRGRAGQARVRRRLRASGGRVVGLGPWGSRGYEGVAAAQSRGGYT